MKCSSCFHQKSKASTESHYLISYFEWVLMMFAEICDIQIEFINRFACNKLNNFWSELIPIFIRQGHLIGIDDLKTNKLKFVIISEGEGTELIVYMSKNERGKKKNWKSFSEINRAMKYDS